MDNSVYDYPVFMPDQQTLGFVMPQFKPSSVNNIEYEIFPAEEIVKIKFHTADTIELYYASIPENVKPILGNIDDVVVVHPDDVETININN